MIFARGWAVAAAAALHLYGQSPCKDSTSGGGCRGSGRGGREWREGRIETGERHEGGGCWNDVPASWISQPLGEVLREHPFSGILFVLLPVVLLHAHQPAVVLMVTDTTTPTDVPASAWLSNETPFNNDVRYMLVTQWK